MLFAGLDIGTTGCKICIFDGTGGTVSAGFSEYGVICDEPAKAEQDVNLVWSCVEDVLKEAVTNCQTIVEELIALSVSVQGDAVIPVDRDFNPLHNALLGMDYRPVKEAKELENKFGAEELFRRTGMRPHPINSLCKIVWLKNKLPEIYRNAWKIVTYEDFVIGRLCGETVIDYTMATRTMAYNLETDSWDEEILDAAGIDRNKLSKVVSSGKVVGQMKTKLAERLGLPSKIKIISGGHDQTCSALGAGVIRDGTALISTGTAEVLSTSLEKPLLSNKMFKGYYPCYRYVLWERFFTFALNHIGGLLFRWFRDNFGEVDVQEANNLGIDSYEYILRRIPEGPSRVMFLPHLNGSGTPTSDVHSKGALIGITMETDRYDIVRSILESLTYELRINLDTWKDAGIYIKEVGAVGGGAKSEKWLQIKADILGKPIQSFSIVESAALGAAILSATGIGYYKSFREAVDKMVHKDRLFEPRSEYRNQYDTLYNIYKEIYPSLKKINGWLSL